VVRSAGILGEKKEGRKDRSGGREQERPTQPPHRFQHNKVLEDSPPHPSVGSRRPCPARDALSRPARHKPSPPPQNTPSLPSHTTTRLRIDTLLLGNPAPFHIRASPRSFAVCPPPPPANSPVATVYTSNRSRPYRKQSQQKKTKDDEGQPLVWIPIRNIAFYTG
jgi:hypothetical protein